MAFTSEFIIQTWNQIQLRIRFKITFYPLFQKHFDFIHYFWLGMINKFSQIIFKISGRNFQMEDFSAITGASIQQLNQR